MAKWTREETGRSFNPYYYMCQFGNMILSVSVPYQSDPWGCRLTKNGSTIHKDYFRLRSKERDDNHPETWESVEDLEKAKERAFRIMKQYIKQNADYWTFLLNKLSEMEAQGEETDDGKEKSAQD